MSLSGRTRVNPSSVGERESRRAANRVRAHHEGLRQYERNVFSVGGGWVSVPIALRGRETKGSRETVAIERRRWKCDKHFVGPRRMPRVDNSPEQQQ